jgi:hypothetical protein
MSMLIQERVHTERMLNNDPVHDLKVGSFVMHAEATGGTSVDPDFPANNNLSNGGIADGETRSGPGDAGDGGPSGPTGRNSGEEGSEPELPSGLDFAPSADVYEAHRKTYDQAKAMQLAVEETTVVAIEDLSEDLLRDGLEIFYDVAEHSPGVIRRQARLGSYRHLFNIDPRYDLATAESQRAQIALARKASEEGPNRMVVANAFRANGQRIKNDSSFGVFADGRIGASLYSMDFLAESGIEHLGPEYEALSMSFARVPCDEVSETFYAVPDQDNMDSGEKNLDISPTGDIQTLYDGVFSRIKAIQDPALQRRAFLTRGLLHIVSRSGLSHYDEMLTDLDRALEEGIHPFSPGDIYRLTLQELEDKPRFRY